MVPDRDGTSERPTPPPRGIDLSNLRKRFGWVLTVVTAVSAALIWLGGLVSGVDVLGQAVSHIGRIIRPESMPTTAPTPAPLPPSVLVGNLSDLRFRARNVPLETVYEAEN